MTEGIRLLLPYAAAAAGVLVVLGLLAHVLRSPIATFLSGLTDDATAAAGAVALLVAFSAGMLSFLAFIELAAWIGMVLGAPLGWWTIAVAAASAAAVVFLATRAHTRRHRIAVTAALVLLCTVTLAGSLLAAGSVYDPSWDGQFYHQQAVASIANGWDYLRDPAGVTAAVGSWKPDSDPGKPFDTHTVHVSRGEWFPGKIWDIAAHYPKGGWVRQAALYAVTGRLESAKATNLALICVAFAVWLAVLLTLAPRRRPAALSIAALITANPIVLVQAFTFKNDGQLGSLLTILIGLVCLYLAGKRSVPVVLSACAAALLLVGIKFTALAYAGLVLVALVAVAVVGLGIPRRATIALVLPLGLSILVATLGLGYSPYVQNLQDHGSPFYPLRGTGAIDIVSNQWPVNFDGTSSLTRLGLSLFSRAEDTAILRGEPSRLKIPFSVHASEIRPYLGFDTYVAGMGPWFGGAILVTAVLLLLLALEYRQRRSPVVLAGLLVELVILVTVVANPESWWARYAPQQWMIPAGAVALGLLVSESLSSRRLAVALAIVLALNSAFVASINFSNVLNAKREVSAALDEIASWPNGAILAQGDHDLTWIKLEERDIAFTLDEADPAKTALEPGAVVIPYTTAVARPR